MGPAPLQVLRADIHFGSVAADNTGKLLAHMGVQLLGLTRQPQGEHREGRGDKRPQPRFERTLLVGRFVDVQPAFVG